MTATALHHHHISLLQWAIQNGCPFDMELLERELPPFYYYGWLGIPEQQPEEGYSDETKEEEDEKEEDMHE